MRNATVVVIVCMGLFANDAFGFCHKRATRHQQQSCGNQAQQLPVIPQQLPVMPQQLPTQQMIMLGGSCSNGSCTQGFIFHHR